MCVCVCWLLLAPPGSSLLLLACPASSRLLLAPLGFSCLSFASPTFPWPIPCVRLFSCWLLLAPGTPWLLLAPPGFSCFLLAPPCSSWLLLPLPLPFLVFLGPSCPPGSSWLLLVSPTSSWLLLSSLCFRTSPLASPGSPWSLLCSRRSRNGGAMGTQEEPIHTHTYKPDKPRGAKRSKGKAVGDRMCQEEPRGAKMRQEAGWETKDGRRSQEVS